MCQCFPRISGSFLVSILFSFLITSSIELFASGHHSGVTIGAASVDGGGGANYSVGIEVPPGTGGMKPALSLNFSSQSDNGLLGVGWSLGGLSVIHRCSKTWVQDGKTEGINFSADDRFCLNGQRLIAVAGVYGADGTEYKTELASYAKVISYGVAGTGPASFRVWTKSGQIMEYGFTADSRIEAQGRAEAMIWAANKISDTVGNYIAFSYFEDNLNGHYRLNRIDYTGNSNTAMAPNASVRFVYADRADKTAGYVAGSKTTSPVRLANVQTFVNETLVRDYRLTYTYAPGTKHSLLSTMAECSAILCKEATTFTWNNDYTASFATAARWVAGYGINDGWDPNKNPRMVVDVNGDGLADMVGFANTNVSVALSTGSGFLPQTAWLSQQLVHNFGGWKEDQFPRKMVDVNGDGKADIVGFAHDGVIVALSTGSSFATPSMWVSGYGSSGGWTVNKNPRMVVDVNGDGLPDVVGFANNHVVVSLNTGSSFEPEVIWLAGQLVNSYGGWQESQFPRMMVDVNADGKADIVGFASNGVLVALSTGSSFSAPTMWVPGFGTNDTWTVTTNPRMFADVNGDGLPDLVGFAHSDVAVAINTGTSFVPDPPWSYDFGDRDGWKQGHPRMLADVNGDGKADFVGFGNSGVVVALSTGSQFTAGVVWIANYGTGQGWGTDLDASKYPRFLADVNGDGTPDVVGCNTAGVDVSLNANARQDLLTSVKDGIGNEFKYTYKPMTDSTVYSKHSTAVFPVVDVQAPMYVVDSFLQNDGLGGFYTLNYRYEGAKTHAQGRGFLGFQKSTMTDSRTGLKTTSTYSQTWPFNGMMLSSELRQSNNSLLEQNVNTYSAVDLLSGRRAVQLNSMTQKTFDLNSAAVTHTTTTNGYDAYGNVTNVSVSYIDGYKTETVSEFTNDATKWILGRLTRSSVRQTTPALLSQTRTTAFAYDTNTGLLTQETIEPGNAALALTKAYTYDSYGNRISVTTSGPGIVSRTTSTTFDARGQFPEKITNALNHSESSTYDARFNVKLSSTGPNGITTQWQYDDLGRLVKEIRADGTETVKSYTLCEINCGGYPLRITTQSTGSVPTTVYFDALGRERLVETHGFDNRIIYKYTVFDAFGRAHIVSNPYYSGETVYTTTNQYDVLGRVIKQIHADGSFTTKAYQGFTTTTTNHKGQNITKIKNSQGKLIKSIDHNNSFNTYAYDPFGNLVNVTDAGGNVTTMEYDIRGHKTKMIDPGMGTWTYTYNTLGQLISQQDANQQGSKKLKTVLEYDLLARLIKRTEPEGISTWEYDTAVKGIGKLAKATGINGFTETHTYDALGRPSSTVTVISAKSYTQSISYDSYSRPASTTYPSGLVIKNVYNLYGFLSEVRNGDASNYLYWKAVTANARGQTTQEQLGNGLTTLRAYDDATGRLLGITTGAGQIQLLNYKFDTIGNLTERKDSIQNLTEAFVYDNLNRVTNVTLNATQTKAYQYDALGNITSKSDVGTYLYQKTNNAGPHAVTTINKVGGGTITYAYDKNGNQISGDGRTLTYTSFNKPKTVAKGTTSNEYYYGPGRGRIQKVSIKGGITTTTSYLGKSYEFVTKSDSAVTEEKHYIGAGGTTVLYTKRSNAQNDTRFLHKDHLGSTDAITNESAAVVERLSFDPWGQRRKPDWTVSTIEIVSMTTRGFTGHEHDDEIGLINMNARMYDPKIGRFLQADVYVQFPETTQGYNRYTYVNNNPLSYTDPSGNWVFAFVAKVAMIAVSYYTSGFGLIMRTKGMKKFFKKHEWARTLGGIIAAAYGDVAGAAMWAGYSTEVMGGSPKDVIQAIALSYASGKMFNKIHKNFENVKMNFTAKFNKIMQHGIAGGVTSVAYGGKFEHGFASSAFSQFASLNGFYKSFGPGKVSQATAAAIVGGTASKLSGGKFENGAASAVFGHLFNDLIMNPRAEKVIARMRKQSIIFDWHLKLFDKNPYLDLAINISDHYDVAAETQPVEIGKSRGGHAKTSIIKINPRLIDAMKNIDLNGNRYKPTLEEVVAHEVGHGFTAAISLPLSYNSKLVYEYSTFLANQVKHQIGGKGPYRRFGHE